MSANFLDVSVSCSCGEIFDSKAPPRQSPLPVRIWIPTNRKHCPGNRPYHLCSDRMTRFNNHIFFAFFPNQASGITPAQCHAWGTVGQDNCIRKAAFPSAFRTNPGLGRGHPTRSRGYFPGRTVNGHQDTASKTPATWIVLNKLEMSVGRYWRNFTCGSLQVKILASKMCSPSNAKIE